MTLSLFPARLLYQMVELIWTTDHPFRFLFLLLPFHFERWQPRYGTALEWKRATLFRFVYKVFRR